jgi:hypothetical protein
VGAKESIREAPQQGFDVLALRMHERTVHFCSAPYYLTASREQLVSVLTLGRVRSFGLVIQGRGELPPGTCVPDQWRAWLPEYLETDLAERPIVMLAETAATSDVLPHIIQCVAASKLVIAPNLQALRGWLEANANAVLIADVDVIRELGRSKWIPLPFTRPGGHPAGLICPRGDTEWRGMLARSVANVLKSDPRKEWGAVTADLASMGVDPSSGRDLLRELLLDMSMDESIEWRRTLAALADSPVEAPAEDARRELELEGAS